VLGGILSIAPGLSHCPAGCVLHSINIDRIGSHQAWMENLNAVFKDNGASVIRLYLSENNPTLARSLRDAGFERSAETGLARRLATLPERPDAAELSCPSIERFLEMEKELTSKTGRTPDGHSSAIDHYAILEGLKITSGYMVPYFLEVDGNVIGSIKLSREGELARIKNLIVAPEHRRKGVATRMIKAFMRMAIEQDMTYVGAYAVENSGAIPMYTNPGMDIVCQQFESTRRLE